MKNGQCVKTESVCARESERERKRVDEIIFQQNIKVNYQTTCLWSMTAHGENLRVEGWRGERGREGEREKRGGGISAKSECKTIMKMYFWAAGFGLRERERGRMKVRDSMCV